MKQTVFIDSAASAASAKLAELCTRLPNVLVEIRATKRSLLGLRRSTGGLVLRIHPELLIDADCSVLIGEWARRRGIGGPGTALRALVHRASTRLAAAHAEADGSWAATLAVVGDLPNEATQERLLHACAEHVHRTWFADLPAVPVTWGRCPPKRQLSHLRFGCYRRTTRRIDLSPRLARPWVATAFLEHVVHHEYCHHRQAMMPNWRREGIHSPRFRTWERSFPSFMDALRWERLALPWLLDDSPPPWYPNHRSTPCLPSDAPPARSASPALSVS